MSLPSVLYAYEARNLSNSQITSLTHSCSRAIHKMCATFNETIMKQCYIHGGFLTVKEMHDIQISKKKLWKNNNTVTPQ